MLFILPLACNASTADQWIINSMHKSAISANNGAKDMEFSSFDGDGDGDDEYSVIRYMYLYKILVIQDDILLMRRRHLRVDKARCIP